MPRILKNIDQIALEKQRDVLYVTFHGGNYHRDYITGLHFQYHECVQRTSLIAWLEQNQIGFYDCFGFSSKSGIISMPYLGELYLDVPFDENDPQYQLLFEHLENLDGTMKIQNITWFYYPLSKALEIKNNPQKDFDI